MKKNCIITASDSKFGDFLIDHWFRSLKENCNLENMDVIVLDYGLSTAQRFYLNSHSVQTVPCKKRGHVVILRYIDMADFLKENSYSQAILADGGDIIFQKDFTSVFDIEPQQFKAVQEDLKSGFSIFLDDDFFSKEDKKKIGDLLFDTKMINAGFIIGPSDKMIMLGDKMNEMIKNKNKFGPDQLVVNYVLKKDGFVSIESKYNFVVATSKSEISIENGIFYSDGKTIPIVHNTGNFSFLRPIENFGYGPNHNKMKTDLLKILKTLHSTSDSFYETQAFLKHKFKEFSDFQENSHKTSQKILEENWNTFLSAIFKR